MEGKALLGNSVTQSNALITAHYSLSIGAKRVLYAALCQIHPGYDASRRSGGLSLTVTAKQWIELYGANSKNAYRDLRRGCSDLYGRSVRLFGDSKNGKNIRWICSEEYSERGGQVTITFAGDMLKHLTGLREDFTSTDMLGTSGLKSEYTVRLYELSKKFEDTGWAQYPVSELRAMLGVGDMYPRFGDFRYRVLDHAVNEVNRKTGIDVQWTPIKRGARIESVRLTIRTKTQLDMFNQEIGQ